MNEVKTFRAASMQEALAIVRRELGMDAVILHTKHVTHRRLLPFLKPREEIEVTAGASAPVRAKQERVATEQRSGSSAGHSMTRSATALRTETSSEPVAVPRNRLPAATPSAPASASAPTSESELVTGVSKAAQIAAELERRQADRMKLDESLKSLERMTGSTPAPNQVARLARSKDATRTESAEVIDDRRADFGQSQKRSNADSSHRGHGRVVEREQCVDVDDVWVGSPLGAKSLPKSTDRPIDRMKRALSSKAPNDAGLDIDAHVPMNRLADDPPNQAAHLAAAMQASAPVGSNVNELTAKLDALQKMVESLTKTSQFRHHDEVPSELFDVYTRLIDADIEDSVARDLVFRLRDNCVPEQLANPASSLAILSGMVEADIKCARPIHATVGRRKVVALVGPTGVGKTTTIAKLAANFRLRDGIKMGLVTVDTYRIAAVEQLRTYAEIIDLPMKVVTSPQDMRRALDELTGLDLVLIDTAGRSPRDDLKIQELKSLLSEASVDEVHLVMSLTASVRGIQMTAEQFKPVNPTAMVLTKLDEAAGMGSLLSVSRQVALPVSYVTTGQDVPDDIEPANASRLARLVLGEDRLFV